MIIYPYCIILVAFSDASKKSKMDTKQLNYLQTMGIEVWQPKNTTAQDTDNPVHSQSDWESLSCSVKNCTLCALHKTRTNTVFGVGNIQTNLLIIGEAPGAREDAQGEPFVGRAGLLLNEMLKSIGLNRTEIYIANILKCRPPNNRDPLPHEVESCTPYLKQQISLIKPKLIVATGRIAAHFLLNTQESLGKLRNKIHDYEKIPLLVTYHPAYLLRSPKEKKKAYNDLCAIKKLLVT